MFSICDCRLPICDCQTVSIRLLNRKSEIANRKSPLLRSGAGERLARLDLYDFTFVADALALVRLGLADRADHRSELPDGLLIGAAHFDLVDAFQLHADVAWNRDAHLVGVADRQHEVLAALLGLVADALHFQALHVAVGHTFDHVRQQRAGQAVQRLARLLIIRARHDQVAFLLRHLDARMHIQGELALGAFDIDLLPGDGDLRLTDRHWFFSNSAHHSPAICQFTRLADRAKQLTTNILFTRLAVAHHALARAHDRDAHAVEDA